MDLGGWITLHRKLLNWEWYGNQPTFRLFMHLLLKANYTKKRWKGILINRGEVVTGRLKLRKETGLSEQNIRTALGNLKSTGEITIKPTNQYSVIKLINYDNYQKIKDEPTSKPTNEPTNNQPATNQRVTTTNKENNINKENKLKLLKRYNEYIFCKDFKLVNTPKVHALLDSRLESWEPEDILQSIRCFCLNTWRMENNRSLGPEWFFGSDQRTREFLYLEQDAVWDYEKNCAVSLKQEDHKPGMFENSSSPEEIIQVYHNRNPYVDKD